MFNYKKIRKIYDMIIVGFILMIINYVISAIFLEIFIFVCEILFHIFQFSNNSGIYDVMILLNNQIFMIFMLVSLMFHSCNITISIMVLLKCQE